MLDNRHVLIGFISNHPHFGREWGSRSFSRFIACGDVNLPNYLGSIYLSKRVRIISDTSVLKKL